MTFVSRNGQIVEKLPQSDVVELLPQSCELRGVSEAMERVNADIVRVFGLGFVRVKEVST